MYRAFNVQVTWKGSTDDLRKLGATTVANNAKLVQNALERFLTTDGRVDGSGIQSNVFPQIDAEVFISHAHKDISEALALAGWLKRELNLTSFIDALVWGHAELLLKGIDKNHCWDRDRQVYDYGKRNGSTSHVHMMLATALAKMIDSTECVFFLNTPNSITAKDATDKTSSAWIYAEIALMQLVRRTEKASHRERFKLAKTAGQTIIGETRGDFRPQYMVDLASLAAIDGSMLNRWRETWHAKLPKPAYSLDTLYKLVPNPSNGPTGSSSTQR